MSNYRDQLPQSNGETLLTDGGLETTLIFEMGFDLPEFASFPLLETPEGRAALREYYRRYVAVAQDRGMNVVLDTPTWRASADWGASLGYGADALRSANTAAVDLLHEESSSPPVRVLSSLATSVPAAMVTRRATR